MIERVVIGMLIRCGVPKTMIAEVILQYVSLVVVLLYVTCRNVVHWSRRVRSDG